ncbi:MAG TPA: hypothetical protein DCZ72_06125 [Armatimonadetes bacterium]|nr:hypothetical protein [Armatimonadota bacterium]
MTDSRPIFALEVVEGPQRGRIFSLREGDLVVGRSPRCSVVLADAEVAPTHCGLRVRPDQVIIAPGGTIAKTFVNGQRLTQARLLRINDRIRVGGFELTLRLQSVGHETRFAVDDRVGPFTIVAELGAGSVGRVYEARDDAGRTVALKVMRRRADWSPREEQHRRALFRREAAVLAAISHSNVVRSHGSGEHERLPWLAMELLDGLTLREKLVGGRLDVRSIERIMFQLCAAVSATHRAGIIHRDLKPANVMLVGPEERVVLADFGLAQPQGAPRIEELDPAAGAGIIRVGRQIGTPAYMAPEQTTGMDADFRSDVWALGAVLYELAAGRRPFPGNDVRLVLTDVVHGCPKELPDDVEPYLRSVVYRCLQKRPDRRFSTAAEMVTALHERRIVQWLPAGPEGPPPQPLAGCPKCRAAIAHPLRCLNCGHHIFRYTDGQVLTLPQPDGSIGLACGKCAAAVDLEAPECWSCGVVYRDLPPEGLSRSAADLTRGRAVVIDILDQAVALLERCPYCNAARQDAQLRCRGCGLHLKAYVAQRIRLELAFGGWSIVCGRCGAAVEKPTETHCGGCGLNFTNGQMPDGTRHNDALLPKLQRELEKRRTGG